MMYDIIYADPPWRYDFSETDIRKIENHYPTMDIKDICNIQIPANDNAVLFLWATAPKLREALMVIDAWGFEYKTHLIWDKKIIGMGYWFRGQHELLMVATKGKFSPPPKDKLISSVLTAQRNIHSRKPFLIRDKIREWYPDAKKLELFARKPNEFFVDEEFSGWDLWGNEIQSNIIIQ